MIHSLWVDLVASAYGHGAEGRGGGWPGLRQVVHIRTTRERINLPDEKSVEDHYYLTSLAPDSSQGHPKALLSVARRHWEIENRLHHTKDRTLREDDDRAKQGARVLARIRSLAIGLFEHIPGASTPLKQILVNAKPDVALRLLKRKRLPRVAI